MRWSLVSPLLLSSLLACANSDTEADPSKPDAAKSVDEKAEPAAPEPEPEPTDAEPTDAKPPRSDVKVHGNLPIMSESELAAEDTARENCVASCVESKQAEAKAAEAIDAECNDKCMSEIPIRQVEVVPDPPPGI